MSGLKIYNYPNGTRAWKAMICARYNGIHIEYPPFNMGVENKTPEFLRMNPLGKVPVLETPEGCIFESNAIARYIARARPLGSHVYFFGRSDMENALVDQWIDFSTNYLEPHTGEMLGQLMGYKQYNPKLFNEAKKALHDMLEILDNHLLTRTFFVGERITLADIIMAMTLYTCFVKFFDPSFQTHFVNLTRWFTTIMNQPEVIDVCGPTVLCEHAEEPKRPEGKKKPERQRKAAQEEAPAETEKPAEKPAEAPAHGGDDEDEEKPSKKPKNPLDLLPESTFNFEVFKRAYMNCNSFNDILGDFWSTWDPNGYCVYFCDYKYNSENTMELRVNNLIGGFFQRLDELRRYGFGMMLIFGDEAPFEISGCWIFRGSQIPQEMLECPDCELYDWRRADISQEPDRQLFIDYLNTTGAFAGRSRPFHSFKCYH